MADLKDGESVEMQGSGSRPYVLKNVGGVYSCTCPAWRNQSAPIERRSCKHLRKLRGETAEEVRVGAAVQPARSTTAKDGATAPPLLLAEKWDGATDLRDWWMSEKLDGVRAYWTGKVFQSRLGNVYHAPAWFAEGLPDVPLDGELWLGRELFQRAVSIVRRQDQSDLWREIQFLIFDAPAQGQEFEARLQFVQTCVAKSRPPYARAHEHVRCQDVDHLRRELARVEALGGEGLMLRRPGSKYEVGRSPTLLKVKTFHDGEARVVGHEPGSGRHKGRLGALFVELADGTRFAVGTGFSDAERERPPAVGSVITFRYQELSEGGVPRFPSFIGVRADAPQLPGAASKGQTSTPAAAPTQRRFECVGGGSDKFWEVTVSGAEVRVRFGRNGTQGQASTKSFKDEAAARAYADKQIEEKTAKGYVQVA